MKTTFQYQQLTFEYLRQNHLPHIISMLAKESVCEHVFFGPNTPEETTAYFQPLIDSMTAAIEKNEPPEQHVFGIWHGDVFLGNCALIPIDFTVDNYLIGYQLDEPFWGKGFGTLACAFLADFAFNTLGAERLSGDCMSTNIGSRKIMEKCGFQLEGRQRNYWKKNGRYCDNLLFGLLRADYDAHKG